MDDDIMCVNGWMNNEVLNIFGGSLKASN